MLRVKTERGGKFLIHKGDEYGTKRGGQTVVVDAKHMSNKWNVSMFIDIRSIT